MVHVECAWEERMTQPSFADISAMSDLRNALEDVDSGRAQEQVNEAYRRGDTSGLTSAEVDSAAMKNILSDLYSIAGDELQAPKPVVPSTQHTPTYQQPSMMDSDDISYEEYLAISQGKQLHNVDVTTGQAPVQSYQPVTGNEWVLVAEAYSGVKSLNEYSIKHSITGTVILEGVTLRESAGAVCNLLNAKVSITDPKMLGIISSGVQYTYMVETMVKTLKTKRKVIRESNYDAAKQCDATIESQKQKVSEIKADLVAYLTKHSISYK